MLNPIYQLHIDGQNIHIYNKYNLDDSLFILRNSNNPIKMRELILSINKNMEDHPIINRLYQKGVIIDHNHAQLIKRMCHIIDELEKNPISKFHLSTILVEKLLASSFFLINLTKKSNAFLEMLANLPKRTNGAFQHYIVLYQNKEELRNLQQLSLSRNQTIFLCKYKGEKLEELGPVYQINHSFCLDCIADNMEKYRFICQTTISKHQEEILQSEYLYSLIDCYLHNKTWLSSIHERKIIFNEELCNYTTPIHPISPSCICLKGNESNDFKRGNVYAPIRI
ncbi:hypothetical protein [Sediminibacillus sp. JSM 1682029]|uniref:hypothetical protein n=1 Tax=Sediminibacillus sp. JSM 1682029 TaxID=3229857 RepID=UPI00352416A1